MPVQDLTITPTAIAGLDDDTTYTMQFVGGDIMHFIPADSAPATEDELKESFVLGRNHRRNVSVSKADSEEIYIWAPGGSGHVVLEESV